VSGVGPWLFRMVGGVGVFAAAMVSIPQRMG
jgi:hypothetical protein